MGRKNLNNKRQGKGGKVVEAKVKQLEMMRAEMYLSHIKAMEDCKTKLTPEQRKKLREMIEAGPMMERNGNEARPGMRHEEEISRPLYAGNGAGQHYKRGEDLWDKGIGKADAKEVSI